MIVGTIKASPVSVDEGGTGITSATAYAVLCGGTTNVNPFQSVASVGTSGQALSLQSSTVLPAFRTITNEYAYIYTQSASQTITAGSAFLFNSNGLMTSGISHSTSSNTDQITINTAGTYVFYLTGSSTTTGVFLSITINGVATTDNQFAFGGAGGFLASQYISNITAGQIIRVVNWDSASITITGSATKVAASITIVQIS
jgi:hypothetical protein